MDDWNWTGRLGYAYLYQEACVRGPGVLHYADGHGFLYQRHPTPDETFTSRENLVTSRDNFLYQRQPTPLRGRKRCSRGGAADDDHGTSTIIIIITIITTTNTTITITTTITIITIITILTTIFPS